MFRNRILVIFMVAFQALSLLVGCGGQPAATDKGKEPAPAAKPKIKIASISPLSGEQSVLGESIKLGVQLALEENKKAIEALGFQVDFVPLDDKADPKEGVVVAERAKADPEVLAIVGTLNSGTAIPISAKLTDANLALVSPANTATEVTDRKLPNMNRIVARDDIQGPAAANFLKDEVKAKEIFIIHDKTAYGEGLAKEVKKTLDAAKVSVAGFEGVDSKATDLSAVLNAVKAKKADAIFYGGIYSQGGLLLKQAREKGFQGAFIGGDGLDSSEMVKLAGKAVVGSYYTSVADEATKTPEGKAFSERYEKKFGKKVESFSAYGYDATQVVLKGLEKAIKDNGNKLPSRKQVQDAIRGTKDFKGVLTAVTFDDKGDNKNAKVFIFQFKEEKYPAASVGAK